MKLYLTLLALLVAAFFVLLSWMDKREAHYTREWKARESILNAKYAEAVSQVRVDSVEVVRNVRQVSHTRDTLLLNLTDTVAVKEYIYQTDTLTVSCLACTASAARLRFSADSSIQSWKARYESVKPSRWDKARPWIFGAVGLYVGLNAPRR